MNYNLRKLYEINIYLLSDIYHIVYFFRSQKYDFALRRMSLIISRINDFLQHMGLCKDILNNIGITYDHTMILDIIKDMISAQEMKDYILLADYYEVRLLPILLNIQETIITNHDMVNPVDNYEKNTEILYEKVDNVKSLIGKLPNPYSTQLNDYVMELTSGGDMTLTVGIANDKRYFHSNVNVWNEAFILAKSWYDISKTKYIIYGLGLGYHISELFSLDEFIDIEVYESDIQIIQLACAYTDNIRLFKNSQIKLVYDPDFTKLSKRLDYLEDDAEFVIHNPSLGVIKNTPIKERLENYFIQYNSVKNQLHILNGNFNRNINNYDSFVDEIKDMFSGKTLYIIAAGPSLDRNFVKLKEIGSNGIILATGTVFKKLINNGITPDYVLVTDPNDRVYAQISGKENCNVPMLFLSTAYYGFAKNYAGKRYIICQKDYNRAEDFAKKNELHTFRTGGSVSTTALDIGITFGCKRIVFLGLDLAYTDNYAHASDTSRRAVSDTKDLRQIEDINGKSIFTNKSLDMYRIWIENRIKDAPSGIEFIDATEGGAKILGMKIRKLSDVIDVG